MKDIKDYLHLYYGCACKYGKSHWVDHEWHFINVNGKLIQDAEYFIIKLFLRPLYDMTEEERIGLREVSRQVVVNTPDDYRIEAAIQTEYLLKKSFDLFGLIDAGLAIDKALDEAISKIKPDGNPFNSKKSN